MASIKEDLVLSLLEEGGITLTQGGVVEVIPQVNEDPADEAEALIVLAKCAAIINNRFLTKFKGIHFLDFLLRGTQRAAPNVAALLAGLEFVGASGLTSVQAPVNGGVYYGWFDEWKVKIDRSEPDSVTVTCNEQTETLSKATGGLWGVKFPIPIGKHAATIAATFQGGQPTQETVNFEVKHWEEMPVTFDEGEIIAQTGNSTMVIDGVVGMLKNGEVIRLERKEAEQSFWANLGAEIAEKLKISIGGKEIILNIQP